MGRPYLHTRLLGTAVTLAAMVAGCASTSEPKPQPVNLSGYSATFKQGYADGCASAGGGARRRDEGRYRDEADYKMGWDDGLSICRRR